MSKNGKRFHGVSALVFDLDGTLIDSKLDLALSMNATLEYLGRKPMDHDQIFSYVGSGVPVLIKRALGEPASEEEIERGIVHFLDYYRAHMLDNTVLYPGVRDALDALLAGRSLAVLTNKPVKFSQAIIAGLQMGNYFRFVYGGNSFEKKKPDPMGLNTLLREFGVAPRQTMMVGDSDVDIQTARNAGTWACGVTYGMGSAKLPACCPDLLLDNLADLPACLTA
ncbi:MAG TPA: HAD-IA family hydrolase [Candidatus Acidoferrales bacterium]|nr:HAD-IA family hydrolase [Candidatus Acidoferrales bacterium]